MNTSTGGRRGLAAVAVLEAVSIVPLAIFLPFSAVALAFAVGILAALNAATLAVTAEGAWFAFLQVINLATCAACLMLALKDSRGPLLSFVVTIGLLCLLLFILGLLGVPDRILKRCLGAQQLALASTVVFWVVIRHFASHFESSGIISADHFRAGLRLLFAGPLALVAIAFFAGVTGRKGYLTALAGVCAGQWAVGFFELGVALQVYALIVAGLVLLGIFVLLLVLGAMSGRQPGIRGPLGPAPSPPQCSPTHQG